MMINYHGFPPVPLRMKIGPRKLKCLNVEQQNSETQYERPFQTRNEQDSSLKRVGSQMDHV
jgi:hypothetical protein